MGTEVANQSNSGRQHSSTLGARVCRLAEVLVLEYVKPRFPSSILFSEPVVVVVGIHNHTLEFSNLLINLKDTFFDTAVGPRQNLARMCR